MSDRSLVTLPTSATRRVREHYCLLILRVPRLASNPFECHRQIFRAGRTIPAAALWPTPDAPRFPVVLECLQSPRVTAGVCPYRGELLRVVWRYEPELRTWTEVARCFSKDASWWEYLHPVLVRELQRSGAGPVEPDLETLSRDAANYLDKCLLDLRDEERAQMLIRVHDLLCARIAATGISGQLAAAAAA